MEEVKKYSRKELSLTRFYTFLMSVYGLSTLLWMVYFLVNEDVSNYQHFFIIMISVLFTLSFALLAEIIHLGVNKPCVTKEYTYEKVMKIDSRMKIIRYKKKLIFSLSAVMTIVLLSFVFIDFYFIQKDRWDVKSPFYIALFFSVLISWLNANYYYENNKEAIEDSLKIK